MLIEFNPQNVFALPLSGIIYPTATIRDPWGTLPGEQGVLAAKDWKSASVAGPGTARGSKYVGAGWSPKLS